MTNPYIMRKGVSTIDDLKDGKMAGFDPARGSVFFVNGITWSNGFATGSDSNPGTFDEPFMSLTYALSKCTTEGNDYIYLLDYYQPTGETWPVSINKSLVSIIGVHGGHPLTKWLHMYAVGSNAAIDVVADDVYLEGIGFQPHANSAGVTLDEGKKQLWINNCYFPSGTYGVHSTAGDWGFDLAITNCFFLSSLSVGGVYINDDPPGVYMENNHFDRHTGVSIDIEQGAYHRIINNKFAMSADTSGLAVTLGTSVSRAFVSGNEAAYGEASGSTSPYKDEGTSTTNNWGLNYKGKAAIDPD